MDSKKTNDFLEKTIIGTIVWSLIWGICYFFIGINLMQYQFPFPLIALGLFSSFIGGIIHKRINIEI